jgi:hypothetical protein
MADTTAEVVATRLVTIFFLSSSVQRRPAIDSPAKFTTAMEPETASFMSDQEAYDKELLLFGDFDAFRVNTTT